MGFEAHWLVDGVIGFTLAEAVALAWWHRRSGRGVSVSDFLPNMASGLSLMFALRAALTGATVTTVALCLLAAGSLHGFDLWRRWR